MNKPYSQQFNRILALSVIAFPVSGSVFVLLPPHLQKTAIGPVLLIATALLVLIRLSYLKHLSGLSKLSREEVVEDAQYWNASPATYITFLIPGVVSIFVALGEVERYRQIGFAVLGVLLVVVAVVGWIRRGVKAKAIASAQYSPNVELANRSASITVVLLLCTSAVYKIFRLPFLMGLLLAIIAVGIGVLYYFTKKK